MSCIREQPTEGVRPNARENAQIRSSTKRFGLPEVLVAVSTSRLSCKKAGKTRTLMPVWDSSGECQLKAHKHLPVPRAPLAAHQYKYVIHQVEHNADAAKHHSW